MRIIDLLTFKILSKKKLGTLVRVYKKMDKTYIFDHKTRFQERSNQEVENTNINDKGIKRTSRFFVTQ